MIINTEFCQVCEEFCEETGVCKECQRWMCAECERDGICYSCRRAIDKDQSEMVFDVADDGPTTVVVGYYGGQV